MISERNLRKWRKEALNFKDDIDDMTEAGPILELCERILLMTQELMGLHLMKKKGE